MDNNEKASLSIEEAREMAAEIMEELKDDEDFGAYTHREMIAAMFAYAMIRNVQGTPPQKIIEEFMEGVEVAMAIGCNTRVDSNCIHASELQ